jgi:hypothetical protein
MPAPLGTTPGAKPVEFQFNFPSAVSAVGIGPIRLNTVTVHFGFDQRLFESSELARDPLQYSSTVSSAAHNLGTFFKFGRLVGCSQELQYSNGQSKTTKPEKQFTQRTKNNSPSGTPDR